MSIHRSVLMLSVLLLLTGSLYAADAAKAERESVHRITVDMQLPDGRTKTIGLQSGRTATIEQDATGRRFNLTATLDDPATGAVSFRFAEVTRMPSGETAETFQRELALEAPRTAGTRSLKAGSDGPIATTLHVTGFEQPFSFAVAGIDLPVAAKTSSSCADKSASALSGRQLVAQPDAPCSRCCISCDGWTACGCAVEMCGLRCCCTVCC